MINNNIADLIARLNNAYLANKSLVLVPKNKENYEIVSLLANLGFLNLSAASHAGSSSSSLPLSGEAHNRAAGDGIAKKIAGKSRVGAKRGEVISIELFAKNFSQEAKMSRLTPPTAGNSAILRGHKVKPISSAGPRLQLISKPGRRVYIGYKEIKDFNHGHKIYFLRTSKGIISSQTALKFKLGGELLFKLSL